MQRQAKHQHYFAVGEFIEIVESENTALWFRRGGNPNRQLFRLELFDLYGRVWRDFTRFVCPLLRLHAMCDHIETMPARFTKKPVAIRRCFTIGGEKSRFAHGVLENVLRLCCLAGHEASKGIELR